MGELINENKTENTFPGAELAKELVGSGKEVESEVEKEEDRAAFDDALAIYTKRDYNHRGKDYDLDRTVDPAITYKYMNEQFALLESPEVDKAETAMTICIPVAIEQEDLQTVTDTIAYIQNSVTSGQAFEVVVWANTKFIPGSEQEVNASSTAKYNKLIARLKEIDHPNLQIKTALQILPEEELNISQIRADFMAAVAIDCKEKGCGYSYPVMWLDADTTFVTKGALEKIATAVQHFDAAFVHANLQFSADWAKGQKLDDVDDATKAVVIDEIYRRQGARAKIKEDQIDDSRAYTEECGLAFAIGTYLRSGGISRESPNSEASSLIEGYNFNSYFIRKELGDKKGGKLALDYKRSARIGTSARRHYELVKRNGLEVLKDPGRYGYGENTGLYTELGVNDNQHQQPITAEQMTDLHAKKESDEAFKVSNWYAQKEDQAKYEAQREKYRGMNQRIINKLLPNKDKDDKDQAG